MKKERWVIKGMRRGFKRVISSSFRDTENQIRRRQIWAQKPLKYHGEVSL